MDYLIATLCEGDSNYRTGQVGIRNARFLPPPAYEVPLLMQQFLDWLNANPNELRPVELAAITHLWFVIIHPFWDSNVRIASLLMNLILLRNGYPIVVESSDDKQRYYKVLQAFQEYRMAKPFVTYISRLVEESLDVFLQAAAQTTPETVLAPLCLQLACTLHCDSGYIIDFVKISVKTIDFMDVLFLHHGISQCVVYANHKRLGIFD